MSPTIVNVEQGQIRGKIQTDLKNKPFLAFYGIPYAKPPTGNLRYRDPEPPESWTGIRDCTTEGVPCYSDQFVIKEKAMKLVETGSEDCLILNVFTRQSRETDEEYKKPVMVWIHGGAFTTGSSSTFLFGPELLITRDIVLVTVNYRLGALGFLSIKDQQIGNAGLKDQVQALRWIKKNISHFSGDPNNVTVFGESAGGSSVQYLILSSLTEGLIHRGIAQSGSVFNPWARGREDNATALARVLGYNETDGEKILKFLTEQPVAAILEGQRKLGDTLDPGVLRYFSPTIENDSGSAFLSEDPVELIRSGRYNQIPLMTGCTSQEGLVMFTAPGLGLDVPQTNFVPFFLGHQLHDGNYKKANSQLSEFYFGSAVPDLSNQTSLINVFTDSLFLRGVYVSARDHAKSSAQPVYLYKITAETQLNTFKSIIDTTEPGVCHGDDLGYLFKTFATPEIVPGSVEEQTLEKFLKLWTNFAHYGNPTPSADPLLDNVVWKPLNSTRMNFLEIGTTLKTDTNLESKRMEFWDDFLKSIPGY